MSYFEMKKSIPSSLAKYARQELQITIISQSTDC